MSNANIVTLLDRFEMAAYHSMTRGQPPFADLMTQAANLDDKGRWDVLITLSRVWMDSGQHCAVAADQFCTLLEQDWMKTGHSILLINVGQKLIRANQGNNDAIQAMQNAANKFPPLAKAIEKASAQNSVPATNTLRAA